MEHNLVIKLEDYLTPSEIKDVIRDEFGKISDFLYTIINNINND